MPVARAGRDRPGSVTAARGRRRTVFGCDDPRPRLRRRAPRSGRVRSHGPRRRRSRSRTRRTRPVPPDSVRWTLRCDPVGGTHPAAGRRVPRAVAARLAGVRAGLRPTRRAPSSTGAAGRVVAGRVGGHRVWARLTRIDGCQIARWDAVPSLCRVVCASPADGAGMRGVDSSRSRRLARRPSRLSGRTRRPRLGPPTSSPRLSSRTAGTNAVRASLDSARATPIGADRRTGSTAVTDRPSSIAPCRASSSSARGATSAARSRRHASAASASSRSTGTRTRPGSRSPTSPEVVDFADVDAVEEVARRHEVDGALTVSADRAVPVVAAVDRAARAAVDRDGGRAPDDPQDRDAADARRGGDPAAAVRRGPHLAEGRAAIETVGLPAVLKPVDSGGQRGLFRIETPGDLESHLHSALAESPGRRGDPRGVRRRHRDERDRRRARRRRPPR